MSQGKHKFNKAVTLFKKITCNQ